MYFKIRNRPACFNDLHHGNTYKSISFEIWLKALKSPYKMYWRINISQIFQKPWFITSILKGAIKILRNGDKEVCLNHAWIRIFESRAFFEGHCIGLKSVFKLHNAYSNVLVKKNWQLQTFMKLTKQTWNIFNHLKLLGKIY